MGSRGRRSPSRADDGQRSRVRGQLVSQSTHAQTICDAGPWMTRSALTDEDEPQNGQER